MPKAGCDAMEATRYLRDLGEAMAWWHHNLMRVILILWYVWCWPFNISVITMTSGFARTIKLIVFVFMEIPNSAIAEEMQGWLILYRAYP